MFKTSTTPSPKQGIFDLFSTPCVIISERADYFNPQGFGSADNITTFAVPKKWGN